MKRLGSLGAVLVAVIALAVVLTGHAQSASGSYTIRAIFDDASYAATGEDVRIAGANVGSIQSLGVNRNNRAAVTISVDNSDFIPFYSNASCTIRPQSLIGEEYVECSPGTSHAKPLQKLKQGPGKGDYFLPVSRTSSPIDSDILQNISAMPVRQALAIVIDELGTGLATRGSDLNAVIRRANPALGNTDKVFKILAAQGAQLAKLANDSETVLKPLAREHKSISGFVTNANTTSVAAAARADDESRTFKLFPTFLSQLRPLLVDLGTLSDKGTPVLNQLGGNAGELGQEFGALGPFASKTRTALIKLGAAAQQSEAPLVSSLPLAHRLENVGRNSRPSGASLKKLLTSLDSTGGIEQVMTLLYRGVSASNGFDSLGHYVRAQPLNQSSCTDFAFHFSAGSGCSARFSGGSASAASAAVASKEIAAAEPADKIVAKALATVGSDTGSAATMRGLLGFLMGKRG